MKLGLKASLPDLVELLSDLTGRAVAENTQELETHVAARIVFLLLGEVADASNFGVLSRRLAARLRRSEPEIASLAGALVESLSCMTGAEVGRREGLGRLGYSSRRLLYQRQGYRCAVCGWEFRAEPGSERTESEAQATLDHVVPFRLGGDQRANLWILCGLCNAIKGSCVHVGEYGRVWIGNHVYWSSERATAFWVFLRDQHCRSLDCGEGPRSGRLFATRSGDRGKWTLDNMLTKCESHARGLDVVRY